MPSSAPKSRLMLLASEPLSSTAATPFLLKLAMSEWDNRSRVLFPRVAPLVVSRRTRRLFASRARPAPAQAGPTASTSTFWVNE